MPNPHMTLDSQRWRLSVAPMLDWTDRHCRYFHRLLSKRALLYTEMVTTGAWCTAMWRAIFNLIRRSNPLHCNSAAVTRLTWHTVHDWPSRWAYTEVNLNCGCPSERVQRGAFGACLMNEPRLVADCVKAMVDVVSIPVTVKHRIGIDQVESYAFVRDFVGSRQRGWVPNLHCCTPATPGSKA
jgi:tRNA-dihydrouridine synthase A